MTGQLELKESLMKALKMAAVAERLNKVLAALLLAVAVAFPSALEAQSYSAVDIHDHDSTVLGARLFWLIKKPEAPPSADPAAAKKTALGGGLELRYSRYHGHQAQSLAPGETIAVGDGDLAGPQDLAHRFDIDQVELLMTSTIRTSASPSRLELDFSLGAGFLEARLRTEGSGAEVLQKNDQTLGFDLGFGARQWLGGVVALEGRLAAFTPNPFSFWGTFGDGHYDEAWSGEAALVVAPFNHVLLRAGFAMMDYTAKHDQGSPVRIRSSGPFLCLQAVF